MNAIFRLAWERFRLTVKYMGDIQGHLAAGIFYFTVLVPFGLIARTQSDPLRIRGTSAPGWLARPPVDSTLDAAKRQG